MQISTTKKWGLEPHPKLSHHLKQSSVTFILQRFSLLPYWTTFFRIQLIPTNIVRSSTSRERLFPGKGHSFSGYTKHPTTHLIIRSPISRERLLPKKGHSFINMVLTSA